jgi:ribosomal protein L29
MLIFNKETSLIKENSQEELQKCLEEVKKETNTLVNLFSVP